MAATGACVLDEALKRAENGLLPYEPGHVPVLRRHLAELLAEFPSLTVTESKCALPSGRVDLLAAGGELPVLFLGVEFRIPIIAWLPQGYPLVSPSLYVIPEPSMAIRPHHASVAASGLVTTPYLRSWKFPFSTLRDAVRDAAATFGQDLPLFSKPPGWDSRKHATQEQPKTIAAVETTAVSPAVPERGDGWVDAIAQPEPLAGNDGMQVPSLPEKVFPGAIGTTASSASLVDCFGDIRILEDSKEQLAQPRAHPVVSPTEPKVSQAGLGPAQPSSRRPMPVRVEPGARSCDSASDGAASSPASAAGCGRLPTSGMVSLSVPPPPLVVRDMAKSVTGFVHRQIASLATSPSGPLPDPLTYPLSGRPFPPTTLPPPKPQLAPTELAVPKRPPPQLDARLEAEASERDLSAYSSSPMRSPQKTASAQSAVLEPATSAHSSASWSPAPPPPQPQASLAAAAEDGGASTRAARIDQLTWRLGRTLNRAKNAGEEDEEAAYAAGAKLLEAWIARAESRASALATAPGDRAPLLARARDAALGDSITALDALLDGGGISDALHFRLSTLVFQVEPVAEAVEAGRPSTASGAEISAGTEAASLENRSDAWDAMSAATWDVAWGPSAPWRGVSPQSTARSLAAPSEQVKAATDTSDDEDDGSLSSEPAEPTPEWITIFGENPLIVQQWRFDVPGTKLAAEVSLTDRDGLRISSVASRGDLWTFVAESGTTFDHQVCELSLTSMPHDWIKKWRKKGYYITSLAGSESGGFLVVLSHGTRYQDQDYTVSETFPSVWIAKHRENRRFITAMATAGSRWVVVVSKRAGIAEQCIEADAVFPANAVQERWKSGYGVTAMAATPTLRVVVMSVPKRGSVGEQEHVRSFAFPSAEIENMRQKKRFVKALIYADAPDAS